jgi:hypothetical protein
MITSQGARKIVRAGQFITLIGGSIGLLAWVVVYLGDLSRPAIFFVWPIGLGAMVGLVGIVLGKLVRPA